ncbi:transforming growth factor beta activator LRRC33-like [Cryptotermes secundus]|uniref:transforming growth factor beta activator LRRC33-like n=1 Tax=Cryptotermes secundus TaxID=105785 RepID=UPI001454CFBD|nr:transforming growth factor beta activator LRRC33-like [Cryptotermes secundus]
MPTDRCWRMLHMAVMCILVHGMAAMTSDWSATIRAKDEQAAMTFSGEFWWCDCWNTTADEGEEMAECRCKGAGLLDVPNNLHSGVQALLLSGLGMSTLKNNSLQPYKNSLQDLTLNEMKNLERIETGTFNNMKHLRTIYISEAPLLRVLPGGIFAGLTDSFLSLRIMRTGLEHFPDLRDISQGSIMHMIDLEANRIREIKSNSVRVKAYQL